MRDEDVRASCIAALEVLCAQFGEDVPYTGGLDRGFSFRGRRVPFLNQPKGIYRAAVQEGSAALSIQTSHRSPYGDRATEDGFLYAYRAGSIDQADNRALRAAFELQTPLVHFQGTRPGWYRPSYPCFVTSDDPATGFVLVSVGRMIGPLDEREPARIDDPVERATRFVRRACVCTRRSSGVVFSPPTTNGAPSAGSASRASSMRHTASVTSRSGGDAAVPNGLSLCSIHHRAFDRHLVGVSSDYEVRVSRRLLEEDDGPMLDLLKGFHGERIEVPRRAGLRPDRERLARRYELFVARGGE